VSKIVQSKISLPLSVNTFKCKFYNFFHSWTCENWAIYLWYRKIINFKLKTSLRLDGFSFLQILWFFLTRFMIKSFYSLVSVFLFKNEQSVIFFIQKVKLKMMDEILLASKLKTHNLNWKNMVSAKSRKLYLEKQFFILLLFDKLSSGRNSFFEHTNNKTSYLLCHN